MRAVVTRVAEASVEVAGELIGAIRTGFLVLVGVGKDDGPEDARYLAQKVGGLRVFADASGAMNLALADVGGSVLAVSQFTLYGDIRKGRRPSFVDAAPPDLGLRLYEHFVAALRLSGLDVQTGRFGASMAVRSTNEGPVTILIDTRS